MTTKSELEQAVLKDEVLAENLSNIIEEKNAEIEQLMNEAESLRSELVGLKQVANYPQIGLGKTALRYRDDNGRAFRPEDDRRPDEETSADRYEQERRDYTMRQRVARLADSEFRHRHQDVSSTLHDNDPSGYYASGESEVPSVPGLIRGKDGRDDYVGYALDRDVHSENDFVRKGGSSSIGLTPELYRTGKADDIALQAEVNALARMVENLKFEKLALQIRLEESEKVQQAINESFNTSANDEILAENANLKRQVRILESVIALQESEKSEKSEKVEETAEPAKEEKAEKVVEETVKEEKSEKSEKVEETAETAEPEEKAEKAEKAEKVEETAETAETAKDEKSEKSEKAEKEKAINESVSKVQSYTNRFLSVPSHLL